MQLLVDEVIYKWSQEWSQQRCSEVMGNTGAYDFKIENLRKWYRLPPRQNRPGTYRSLHGVALRGRNKMLVKFVCASKCAAVIQMKTARPPWGGHHLFLWFSKFAHSRVAQRFFLIFLFFSVFITWLCLFLSGWRFWVDLRWHVWNYSSNSITWFNNLPHLCFSFFFSILSVSIAFCFFFIFLWAI